MTTTPLAQSLAAHARSGRGLLPFGAFVLVAALGCPSEPAPDAGPIVVDAGPPPGLCEVEPAGTCGTERPWLCAGEAPPRYDCATCGCEDGARCEDGICYSIPLLDGQRDLEAVPDDLEIDRYFTLVDRLTRGGTRLDRWVDEAKAKRTEDPRYGAVAIGLVTGSARERALAAAIAEGLDATPIALEEELSRDAICTAVGEATRERGEGLVSVTTAATFVSREVCAHPELFPTCQVPFAADCALREGARPLEVLVFDLPVVLDRVERVLLARAGGFPAGEVDFQLERSIGRFRASASNLSPTEGFAITLDGAPTFARFSSGDAADFGLIVDGSVEPAVLLGFRVLWNDAATQAFFVEHDISPEDCSVAREDAGERLAYACENGAYRVDAVVDASDYTLVDVTRSGP